VPYSVHGFTDYHAAEQHHSTEIPNFVHCRSLESIPKSNTSLDRCMILRPLSSDEYIHRYSYIHTHIFRGDGKVTTRLVLLNSVRLENTGNW